MSKLKIEYRTKEQDRENYFKEILKDIETMTINIEDLKNQVA